MKFKEGDNVIVGGYSGGAKAVIMKVLENSNRYRLKTQWNGSSGSMVEAEDVFENHKEYHKNYINFAKNRIEQAKRKFEATNEYFNKKISESEFAISEQAEVKKNA